MEQDLELIDANRCQGEFKEGSFMTFGPRRYVRCGMKPTWIAVEINDGKFGGAMSLCDDCKRVCEIQLPETSFQRLLPMEVQDA